MFGPLEQLWHALELWFSLLAAEVQEGEIEENNELKTKTDHGKEDHAAARTQLSGAADQPLFSEHSLKEFPTVDETSEDPLLNNSSSSSDLLPTLPCGGLDSSSAAQPFDPIDNAIEDVGPHCGDVISVSASSPRGNSSQDDVSNPKDPSSKAGRIASVLGSSTTRPASAESGDCNGLTRQDSRHIAAALMAARPKIIQRQLSITPGNDSIRLSQPAVEMNLGRWSGDFARGWGNFTSNDNPSTVVTAEDVNGAQDSGSAGSSPGSESRQQRPRVEPNTTLHFSSANTSTSSPDDSDHSLSPGPEVFDGIACSRESQINVEGIPSAGHCHHQRDCVADTGDCSNVDDHHVKGNSAKKQNGTVSPLPGGDVVSMTAERLCAVTRGFYICCCAQSHWESQ